MKPKVLQAIAALGLCVSAGAQVNSGSNGSDGAFNPTTDIVINMTDHPNGIYQYTSVHISNGVTVTFIPNANNTPVVWLVQSNVVINGAVYVNGQSGIVSAGGVGGPGGYRGGNPGSTATPGQGPGGGGAGNCGGGNASYGSLGATNQTDGALGNIYGNAFLIPLLGGSGGGGTSNYTYFAGGGGGGAILVAASGNIQLNGIINANGGWGVNYVGNIGGGGGSGGGVRLVASAISGSGNISCSGGVGGCYGWPVTAAGSGRVRFDTYANNFGGSIGGVFSQGYQPILIQTNDQGAQLTVTSVGGVPVSTSPSGQLSTPDAVLSAQQNNPIPVIVHCSNIPLNTQITVNVKLATGAAVSATGLNSTGTLSSSMATVLINMPRGGGIIYATAATGN